MQVFDDLPGSITLIVHGAIQRVSGIATMMAPTTGFNRVTLILPNIHLEMLMIYRSCSTNSIIAKTNTWHAIPCPLA